MDPSLPIQVVSGGPIHHHIIPHHTIPNTHGGWHILTYWTKYLWYGGWRCSGSPIHHTLTYHTILILVDGGLVAPYQSIPVSQLVGQWPEGIPPTRNILHILIPWFPIVRNTLNLWWSAAKAKKRRRDTRASTIPYKEEEIFGEFHTSFAFLFHSFHFKWQATLVVLCHVRLQHQFDSYFVSFLCVYICILWGPLRILSWACCVCSPSHPLLQGPNIWAVEWIIH